MMKPLVFTISNGIKVAINSEKIAAVVADRSTGGSMIYIDTGSPFFVDEPYAQAMEAWLGAIAAAQK